MRRLAWIVLFAAVITLAPQTSYMSGGQASISWSQERITHNIGSGQGANDTVQVTFVSSQSIDNAYLWVSPGLRPFVRLQTTALSLIAPNQEYTVLVSFVIPPGVVAGSYDGTIHLRTNNNTIPRPLQVTVNVDFGNNVIPSSTHVLSDTSLSYVSSITEDGATLTFSSPPPEFGTLKEGDIIAIGSTYMTPLGLLRKVTDLSALRGGGLVVHTVQGTIEETFDTATIDLSETLTAPAESIVSTGSSSASRSPNDMGQSLALQNGFFVRFDDVVVYDNDGDPSTRDDQVRLDGDITVTPRIDFHLEVDWRPIGLKKLRFIGRVDSTGTLTAHIDIAGDLKRKIEVYRKCLTPQTVWVGSVPIVLTPVVAINLGVDGKLEVGVEAGIQPSASAEVGLFYEKGQGWSHQENFSASFRLNRLRPTAGVRAKAFSEFQTTLLLDGGLVCLGIPDLLTSAPYLLFRGYLEFDADLFDDPWWTLFGGLEARGGVKFAVLGRSVADYESPDLFGAKLIVAQAAGPYPTPTPTPTPSPTPLPSPRPSPSPSPSPSSSPSPSPSPSPNPSPSPVVSLGWTMEGFNPSRTNRSPVVGPNGLPSFQVIASNVPGKLRRIAPNGSLLVADMNSLASYSTAGQLQWNVSASNIVDVALSPAGIVYVSTAGSLFALNGDTGQNIWTYLANTGGESSPLAIGSNGTIYFVTGASLGVPNKLSAINSDGSLRWEYLPNFRGYERVVLSTDESRAYILGLTNNQIGVVSNLASISTDTGQVLNTATFAPRDNTYAYAPWDTVYTADTNANLLGFSPDLQTSTTIQITDPIGGIAAITPAGQIVVPHYFGGTMAAFSRFGNNLWSSTEPLSSGFADGNGVLNAVAGDITSGQNKDLVAINIATGQQLWRQSFASPISSVFLGGDGRLYLTSGVNLIKSSATQVSQITKFSSTNMQVSSPVVSSDGSNVAFVVNDPNTNNEGRLFAASANGTNLRQISPTNLRIDFSKGLNAGGSKLAFVACDGCPTFLNGDVYVINVDGSGLTRLTTSGRIASLPRISADGNSVVFTTLNNEVFLIRSNGSGLTQLTLPQCGSCQPLPNGDASKVAFLSYDGTTFKINVANVSGGQPTVVTDVGSLGQPFAFTWSADGLTVGYTRNSGVSAIKTDGTGFRPLESEGQAGTAGSPSMTFDGSVLAYERFIPDVNIFVHDVFVINSDGTNRRNLTNTPAGTDGRGFPLTSNFPSISQNSNVITFISTADLDPGKNFGHLTQVFAIRIGP